MKKLFDGRSTNEPATLANIKAEYNFRHAKKKAMSSFNHTEEFVNFSLEGYMALLVMKLLNMETVNNKFKDISHLQLQFKFIKCFHVY